MVATPSSSSSSGSSSTATNSVGAGAPSNAPVGFVRPPKRSKSGYTFFISQNYNDVASADDRLASNDVIRRLARMWRGMAQQEKAVYLEMARKDQERYRTEKQAWVARFGAGETRKKRRRQRREVGAPVRTCNAFIFYEQATWPRVKSQYPNYTHVQIIREIAKLWRALSEAEKAPFREQSRFDRERYRREMVQFRSQRIWLMDAANMPPVKHA